MIGGIRVSMTLVAVLACVAMGLMVAWKVYGMRSLQADVLRLETSRVVLENSLEQARISQQVTAERAKQAMSLANEMNARITEISKLKGGCIDEKIDPDLADILRRNGL